MRFFSLKTLFFSNLEILANFRGRLKQRFFYKKTRFEPFFEKQRFLAIFHDFCENFFHEKQVFCVLVPYRQRILQKVLSKQKKFPENREKKTWVGSIAKRSRGPRGLSANMSCIRDSFFPYSFRTTCDPSFFRFAQNGFENALDF